MRYTIMVGLVAGGLVLSACDDDGAPAVNGMDAAASEGGVAILDTLTVDAPLPTPDTLPPASDAAPDVMPDTSPDTGDAGPVCLPIPDPGNAGSCVNAPADLIAWWRGEDNFNDELGNTNGTGMGGTGFTEGRVGRAISLNGNSQYVDFGDITTFDFTDTEFTVEAWVKIPEKPTLNPGGAACTATYPVVSNMSWGWSMNYKNTFSFGKYYPDGNSGTGTGISACTTPLADDTWYHVAVVHRTTSVSIYLNGMHQGTREGTPSAIYYTPNDRPQLGRRTCANGTYFLKGALDEVSIYKRALTGAEIMSIASAGSAGKCVPG